MRRSKAPVGDRGMKPRPKILMPAYVRKAVNYVVSEASPELVIAFDIKPNGCCGSPRVNLTLVMDDGMTDEEVEETRSRLSFGLVDMDLDSFVYVVRRSQFTGSYRERGLKTHGPSKWEFVAYEARSSVREVHRVRPPAAEGQRQERGRAPRYDLLPCATVRREGAQGCDLAVHRGVQGGAPDAQAVQGIGEGLPGRRYGPALHECQDLLRQTLRIQRPDALPRTGTERRHGVHRGHVQGGRRHGGRGGRLGGLAHPPGRDPLRGVQVRALISQEVDAVPEVGRPPVPTSPTGP